MRGYFLSDLRATFRAECAIKWRLALVAKIIRNDSRSYGTRSPQPDHTRLIGFNLKVLDAALNP
jgi:hypothetical protein